MSDIVLTVQGKVYVNPLIEEIVSTPQDIVDLLEKGNTQRKTGATDWVSLIIAGFDTMLTQPERAIFAIP